MKVLSTAEAEGIEAEWMYSYAAGAPDPDQEVLGITTRRLGGGVVLSARTDPSQYWSKALGFGFEEPITADLIDRILEFYRAEGNSRATLQFAPQVLPEDWEEIRRTRGLQQGVRMTKLAAPIESLAAAGTSDLRIAPVTKDDAEEWATAVQEGFGFPAEGIRGMFAASVGRRQFFTYAAWDGDAIVGGAHVYVKDGVASFNTGAVVATHRRRGAQTALLAARIGKARELGCRWGVAEFLPPHEGDSRSSINNMTRSGLKVLYERQDYVWNA